MRDVVLQMHMTLDGFADTKTGFVPIMDRTYATELERALATTGAEGADTYLLGHGTYTQFNSFWPKVYAKRSGPKKLWEAARFLTETPKVVFSKTLRRATWANTTIARGPLKSEIARLKRRPGKNLLIPGGVAFPRAMIEQDLVDEYLLSIAPLVAGGRQWRLFGSLPRPRDLKFLKSWTFSNGFVLHRYRRDR